jgi:hypothetical protein
MTPDTNPAQSTLNKKRKSKTAPNPDVNKALIDTNRNSLTDMFGHLNVRTFGDRTIGIEFLGEEDICTINVDAPYFEAKVRQHIKQLQVRR